MLPFSSKSWGDRDMSVRKLCLFLRGWVIGRYVNSDVGLEAWNLSSRVISLTNRRVFTMGSSIYNIIAERVAPDRRLG